MSMLDKVAKFIRFGIHEQAAQCGMSTKDLYQHVKQVTDQPYPQQSISFTYSIKIGDVLKPHDDAVILLRGEPIVISVDQRFVVYRISNPSAIYQRDYERENGPPSDNDMKVIILVYNVSKRGLDVEDITKVMGLTNHVSLLNLLEVCEVTGNVADLLD